MRNNFESSPANTTNENSTKTPEASGESGKVLDFLKKIGNTAYNGFNKAKDKVKELAKNTITKLKENEVAKKAIAVGLSIAAVAALAAYQHNTSKKAEKPTGQKPGTEFASKTTNGVDYDYSETFQNPNRLSKGNFGEDLSQYHGDAEKMTNELLKDSHEAPEIGVTLFKNIATENQKKKVGLNGLSEDDLDKMLDGENGGETQEKIDSTLREIFENPNTKVLFIVTDGRVACSYGQSWEDKNGDGIQTPDETELTWNNVKRSNAPQFVVINTDEEGNTTYTVINERCGGQIDLDQAPSGLEEGGDVDEVIPEEDDEEEDYEEEDDDEEEDKEKNSENAVRIDNNIRDDASNNTGGGEVKVGGNSEISDNTKTERPTGDVYTNNQNPIVQSDGSKSAENVVVQNNENNYSENRGGANSGEYAPVVPNNTGQATADANRIENNNLPGSSSPESENILSDLGIN